MKQQFWKPDPELFILFRGMDRQMWHSVRSPISIFPFFHSPWVKFTNIFKAHLRQYSCANKKLKPLLQAQKSFARNFRTKKPCIKCWWNWPLVRKYLETIFKICKMIFLSSDGKKRRHILSYFLVHEKS